MARDPVEEHFREESVEIDGEQKGEAKRNDTDYAFL